MYKNTYSLIAMVTSQLNEDACIRLYRKLIGSLSMNKDSIYIRIYYIIYNTVIWEILWQKLFVLKILSLKIFVVCDDLIYIHTTILRVGKISCLKFS